MLGCCCFNSGESMENALRACCKGIKIGKILIHREGDNGKQVAFSSLLGFCVLPYNSIASLHRSEGKMFAAHRSYWGGEFYHRTLLFCLHKSMSRSE
jgi:hypothetical protein